MPRSPKPKQKITQKHYCNKFNKDYKYGPHKKRMIKTNKQKKTKGIERGATVGGSKHESLKQHNEQRHGEEKNLNVYIKKKQEFGHDLQYGRNIN